MFTLRVHPSTWRTAVLQDVPCLRQLQVPRTLAPPCRQINSPWPRPSHTIPPALLRHAAAAGSVSAAVALALHCDALGDDTAAVRLYKSAATRGHAVAQAVLGCGHYWGTRGLARDPEDAMLWLGRAAKQLSPIVTRFTSAHRDNDSTHTAVTVGLDQHGVVGTQEVEQPSGGLVAIRSLAWSPAYAQDVLPTVALLRSTEHVVPWAALTSLSGCPQQQWRVLELARWLAVASLLLGLLHLDGEGSRVDVPEAMRWLKQAALLGSAEAERVLGSLYNTGQFG